MYNEIDIEDIKEMIEAVLSEGGDCSITMVRMGEKVSLIFHDNITPTIICDQMSEN